MKITESSEVGLQIYFDSEKKTYVDNGFSANLEGTHLPSSMTAWVLV